jgi:L-lactate dehydrogenase complex protein LldG
MKFRNRKGENINRNDEYSGRNGILERLTTAVSGKTKTLCIENSPRLYAGIEHSLSETFREMAEKVNAQVSLVDNHEELADAISSEILENGWKEIVCPESQVRNLLLTKNFPVECQEFLSEDTDAAITGCEYLVATLGSVIVSSAQAGSRKIFVYPPVHLVVANASQIVETLEEGYEKTVSKYGDRLPSMITVITGPSRTADIEKTLILGAHGPKKLHIFILNDLF